MTRTYTIILVLISAIFHDRSYGQINQQQDFIILALAETPIFMDIDTLKGASLNENEISILVNLADKCVQRWNEELPIKYTGGYDGNRKSEDYYRQYISAYNESGNKLVWINFIKKSDTNEIPKQLFMSVDNPHYFNCWVNLTQLRIWD
jgi:hypothetical protein